MTASSSREESEVLLEEPEHLMESKDRADPARCPPLSAPAPFPPPGCFSAARAQTWHQSQPSDSQGRGSAIRDSHCSRQCPQAAAHFQDRNLILLTMMLQQAGGRKQNYVPWRADQSNTTTNLGFPPPHLKVWAQPIFLRKCFYNKNLSVKTKNYKI